MQSLRRFQRHHIMRIMRDQAPFSVSVQARPAAVLNQSAKTFCRLGAHDHQGEVGVHMVPYLATEVTVGEKVKHSLIYLITQWADGQTGWFSGACHSRRSAVQQWFVAASHTKILHFKGGPSSPDCIHSGDLAMPANRAEYADFTMCCPTLTTAKRFDPLLGATELGVDDRN
jgi:hypothetical protein